MNGNTKIRDFVERWRGRGYEKGQSQVFWIELLTDVLGVENATAIENLRLFPKIFGFVGNFS